jgi:glycosyltransferase involved in cell wall biosynthesis
MVIITLSSVQTANVRQSMMNRFPIHQIPNGIDLDTYKPLDQEKCRHVLGIPRGKKVLMFAATALHAVNKGGDLLIKALEFLPQSLKTETVLLMIGEGGDKLQERVGVEVVDLGYVNSERLKAAAYSAADLFVLPSRAESLPLVLQESMACGTPMVAFKTGGMIDLVRPGLTGHLAKLEDSQDLARGLVELLEDDAARAAMSQQCRKIAVEEYSLDLQIRRHIDLYRQVCQG